MYILQRKAWLFRRLLGQLLFASLLCAAAALFKTLYAMQLSAFLDALIATSVFSGHLLLMGAGLLALHVLVHICAEINLPACSCAPDICSTNTMPGPFRAFRFVRVFRRAISSPV